MSTRNALSPNFVDVNNAVNGGGPFAGPAQNGDIVRIPASAGLVTWGPNDALLISKDISLIGAGMDETQATPRYGVATIIKITNTTGLAISATFQGSENACRISGIVFELTTYGNSYLLNMKGRCYRRRNLLGNVVGGLRMDNIRFRNSSDGVSFNISKNALLLAWGGPVAGSGAGYFVTGSYDHNFVDYQVGSTGAEVFSFGCSGAPTGLSPDGWGQYQWEQPYTYGGGDDTELNVVYIEDNIFHRLGYDLGTLSSGARIICRYNTSWGGLNGHGIDGNCMGPCSWESYNNWFNDQGSNNPANPLNTRGGAQVIFNNRFTGPHDIASQTYRQFSSQSNVIGPATGRNFLDENYRGVQSFSDSGSPISFTPTSTPTDTRIGSIYASGTGGVTVVTPGIKYTLAALDGTIGTDAWKGFIIVNTSIGGDGSNGDQGHGSTTKGQYAGYISSSTNTMPCTITVVAGANQKFNLVAGQNWEIRRVKTYFCNPGSGVIPLATSGRSNSQDATDTETSGFYYIAANGSGKHKYWSGQVGFGLWQAYNLRRDNSSIPWSSAAQPVMAGSLNNPTVNGGFHDGALPTHKNNDGTGAAYPTAANNSNTLHVGAHWNAPGYTEGINMGDSGAPTQAYGAVYPNAMVSGAVVNQPAINSTDRVSFIQGTGGTFQCTYTSYTSAPTFTKSTTNPGESFPATGTTFSSSGLLTVGATSAAGVYTFTITATNGGEVDTQVFTLTITAVQTRVIAISGSLAFGDRDINTNSTLSFSVINNGNDTLTVSNITLPSGFVADNTSFTVLPGVNHQVSVTFSPTAATTYSGTVTVTSDKTSGTNTIAASGTGVTRVMGLSGDLAFGDITTDQTATRQVVITNSGNRALSITAIAYPEGFSGDFSTASIAAGANKILNVTFAPLLEQSYSGSINITSNKTSGTSTMSASGVGVSSATKIVQLSGDLAFGSVQTGTTVDRILVITNGGDTTLTVSDITFPSGFTADWTSGTIASGASQNVTVTFAPITGTTYSGTVTVTSDATGGINTTTASGTGVVPSTKIIGLASGTGASTIAFGNVVTGASPTRTLAITNTGSAPLTVSGITYPTGFSGAFSGAIAPGATQNVTVTFSPTLVQSYNGTITVASDATSGTNTIAVTGSGVISTTRVIGLSGDLAFGNVQKNHSVQRIMTILNTGTGSLTVSGITLPTGFTANWTSGSIAPNASQNVVITFSPTTQQTYGGTITVASNKTSGVNTITCSGNGTNKKQVPFFLVVG